MLNNRGTMEDHIKNTKGKTEAALQTIFNLAENEEFVQIEMETIWRLVESCIIPIIKTYGAETWILTKNETQQLQTILDNCIKRIIKTSRTTPSEIISLET